MKQEVLPSLWAFLGCFYISPNTPAWEGSVSRLASAYQTLTRTPPSMRREWNGSYYYYNIYGSRFSPLYWTVRYSTSTVELRLVTLYRNCHLWCLTLARLREYSALYCGRFGNLARLSLAHPRRISQHSAVPVPAWKTSGLHNSGTSTTLRKWHLMPSH